MFWDFVDHKFICDEEFSISLIWSSKVMERPCIFESVVGSLKQLVNLSEVQLADFAELQRTEDATYIS